MIAVPADTPVTIPVDEPMVAMAVLPLLQSPPPAPSLSVVVVPTHVCNIPVIVVGPEFTVTVVIAVQPVGRA